MVRADFQRLARTRIKEAHALLKLGLNDGAYYLAGYAVECALKACIAKQTRKHEFPDKKIVDKSYTHDLGRLLEAAGLESHHDSEMETDDRFALNWALTKQWTEASRYQSDLGEKAPVLYNAITDQEHGVLKWLKKHW